MDYLNDFPYKQQKEIIRNDDVYNETQTAGDIAYDILSHVSIVFRSMPEFDEFLQKTGMRWNHVSWPVDKCLESDIQDNCRDVLDFANTLSMTRYEEIYMIDFL